VKRIGRFFETGDKFIDAMDIYMKEFENPNTPEKREKFFEWAEENGYCERIIDCNDN
jgi:hypothetical protein